MKRLDDDQGAGRPLRTEDVVAVDWADGSVDVDTEEDVVRLATPASTDIGPALRSGHAAG